MLRNLNQERATGRICGTPHSGVLASAIPTDGDYPALGLNDIDPGDPADCEYAVEILSLSAGTMDVAENTAFTYTPPSADYVGTVTGTQRVRKNGVAVYDEDISFVYASATTSVSSDLAASYGVQAFVGASLAAAYSVAQQVSADLAAVYSLNCSVSADLTAAYAVSARVSASLTAGYAVDSALSLVSASLAAEYTISAEVSASLAAEYAATQFIDASLSAAYAINAAVSADLVALYGVAGADASTAVSADLACAYMVSAYVRADLAAAYAVEAITNYARAPAGPGYAPKRNEQQDRPTSGAQSRPASTQRNDR